MFEDFQGTMLDGAEPVSLAPPHIAIVVSKYNHTITDNLLRGAIDRLRELGVPDQNMTVCRVPGAWELPVVAARVLDQVDAVVCLGAVIRGETTHDVHINNTVSRELGRLAIQARKPVGFGLLTTNNVEQAIQRSGGSYGNKGHEAVDAVIELLRLFGALAQPTETA